MVLSKKEIGLLIKEARKHKSEVLGNKYTQNMLAKDLVLSRGYIGDIENGRIYPNYVLLNKIAEKCEVSLSFFEDETKTIEHDITKSSMLTKPSSNHIEITDVKQAMDLILSQPGIMLHGEMLSDESKMALANAIQMGLAYAEQIQKKGKK
ncbi:MAG: transcriptional regulator with XRE-family HTH domain [Clostridium sp.]|jgi:transcriptional regulator with XRE-family HTH domain